MALVPEKQDAGGFWMVAGDVMSSFMGVAMQLLWHSEGSLGGNSLLGSKEPENVSGSCCCAVLQCYVVLELSNVAAMLVA